MKGRPSAVEFDPVAAQVWAPGRQAESSGEAAADAADMLVISSTRIKAPRQLFTGERENQGHAQSVSDLVIEIKNEGGGDLLTADMWITHRGITYNIKGRLGVPSWATGTTLYQVSMSNDFGTTNW